MKESSAIDITGLLDGAILSAYRLDGGVWSIRFEPKAFTEDVFVLAQELEPLSPEDVLEDLAGLRASFPRASDFEDTATAFLLSAARGQSVTDIEVNEASDVFLSFPDDVVFRISGDVPIVDWMWCISEFDTDPYRKAAVFACFAPGVIERPTFRHHADGKLE